MSFYTLYIKYLFFLFFLLGYLYPEFSCSQSIEHVAKSSEEPSHLVGEILFTANLNGLIENCKCGKPPLGGMPQISTLVNKYLSENKYSYYIDGGDFLNTYPYPALNSAVIDIYKLLNIKYVALGDQEWIDTDELDNRVLYELQNKIIASNFRIKNHDLKRYGQLDLQMGMKAYILSYLDEISFFVSDDKREIQFNDDLFTSNYNEISSKEGLNILLFHGTRYTLDLLIEKFPGFNLVLWGHEQNDIVNVSDNPAIIGGGSDGEHLKKINIYRNKNNYIFSVNSIPVTLEIEEDLRIRAKIDEFKLADKKVKVQD